MTDTRIRFTEGRHASDLTIEANLANFCTIVMAQGAGGSGNGLRYFAVNIPQLLASGPFTRQSNYPDHASAVGLRLAARAEVNNACANPSAMTLQINDEATTGLWNPGDTIVVHYPSMMVIEQTCTILGFSAEEGASGKTLYLNQHPVGSLHGQLALLRAQINDAVSGGSRATISSPSGLTGIDLSGQQAVIIRDATGVVRARGGLQTDGKNGWRFYSASGTLISTLITGTPGAGQSSVNMDLTV